MPWLLGKDWDQFYRVRLADTSNSSEKASWCRKNIPANHWATNFGLEVFYFLTVEDATLFKLRWEGVSE